MTVALARPVRLSAEQRLLAAHVADEYAEGFVEDQYPEHQGGEITGWDARDALCLTATARRLRRAHADELRLTDRQRTLLAIACDLFADEYHEELAAVICDLHPADARQLTYAAGERLMDGTDHAALFTAKGL